MTRKERNKKENNDGWMTEAETAAFIGYSVESLRKMRARGYIDKACTRKALPHYRIGRIVLYKKTDILNFMECFRVGD